MISQHLAERVKIDGQRPTVRLVSRQQGAFAGGADSIDGSGGLRVRNKSKKAMSGGGSADTLENVEYNFDDDEDDSDVDESLALIKEWRRMVNEEISPFFHSPRYAGKRSKFQSLNSNPTSGKQLSEKCTTWCKLLLH